MSKRPLGADTVWTSPPSLLGGNVFAGRYRNRREPPLECRVRSGSHRHRTADITALGTRKSRRRIRGESSEKLARPQRQARPCLPGHEGLAMDMVKADKASRRVIEEP